MRRFTIPAFAAMALVLSAASGRVAAQTHDPYYDDLQRNRGARDHVQPNRNYDDDDDVDSYGEQKPTEDEDNPEAGSLGPNAYPNTYKPSPVAPPNGQAQGNLGLNNPTQNPYGVGVGDQNRFTYGRQDYGNPIPGAPNFGRNQENRFDYGRIDPSNRPGLSQPNYGSQNNMSNNRSQNQFNRSSRGPGIYDTNPPSRYNGSQ